jgi:hypothetical protein
MSSAGEMLKVLTECSLDNLFVLTGILFMGIAVLGDISTWIRPGKPGRFAAAILSPILLSAGIWIHSHEHVRQLKVVGLDFRTENNLYEGSCPVDLEFDGQVQASSAGTVLTEVEYSDGSKSPQLQLDFARSETKSVKVTRRMERTGTANWARLTVISPRHLESEKTFFAVRCERHSSGEKPGNQTHKLVPADTKIQVAASQVP